MTYGMDSRRCNILMLGGAKRVSMARMLLDAASSMGVECRLYSYELDRHVPVACVAEVIEGLRWSDPKLAEHLNGIIADKAIGVVIPFVDGALDICASGSLGAWSPTTANAHDFYDKLSAHRRFIDAGLPVAALFDSTDPHYPVIAKPVCGSASKGLVILRDQAGMDIFAATHYTAGYIIEDYIADADEYTVDCYVNRIGEPICISVRRRLCVIGGEVSETVTVDRPDIVRLSHKALTRLGITGAATLQWIEGAHTGPLLMEINTRLGGGAVCSIHAGADIPAMILTEASGATATQKATPRTGTLITRYQQEVVFRL